MRNVLLLLVVSALISPAFAQRVVTSLDSDWRFLNKDAGNGAQEPEYNDSAWRKLNVPHDWSIEGPAAESNPSGGAGGFFPDGIGWYHKHFSLPDADSGKRFFVVFDSVMCNSDVWINGRFLGHRPYGYVELNYELTGDLNFGGKDNVLAVRVDQERQPASRYYMGAGILGHVRLVAMAPVHFEHSSLFVSTPKIDAAGATVHVEGVVVNQGDAAAHESLTVSLGDPQGQSAGSVKGVAIDVPAGGATPFSQDIVVPDPKLWSLETPQLYSALVQTGGDTETVSFGIRSIKFTPEKGFFLNGKNVRLQGVCLHADCSAFGAAVPAGAWERRLVALKEIGVNALRTAHNPPSPEFLELCDRMGFLVMDEMYDCWDVGKNKYDYHLFFDQWSLTDLRDTVRRDRNHPSIILYSAGNEIHDTPNAEASKRILSGLVAAFHANDPTRPVTQALFRPNTSHDYDDGLADLLDVIGTNYRNSELIAAQKVKPTRTLVGTENHLEDVQFLANNPPLSGIFIWAGVDYLGEAFRWPQYSSGAGLLDRTDTAKASGYQVATVWLDKPFVHILRGTAGGRGRGGRGGAGGPGAAAAAGGGVDGPPPAAFAGLGRGGPSADWTPANQDSHRETVTVYSNCPKVELTLNGAAIEAGPTGAVSGMHVYSVTYAPGVLKAVGFDSSGSQAASEELHTAGVAAKIELVADKEKLPNDWDDVCFIRATVVDANGVRVPAAADEISFAPSGPGKVAAVDSADNNYHESFQGTQRKAYFGTCYAIIKSTTESGTITVTASAKGLADGSVTVQAAPAH